MTSVGLSDPIAWPGLLIGAWLVGLPILAALCRRLLPERAGAFIAWIGLASFFGAILRLLVESLLRDGILSESYGGSSLSAIASQPGLLLPTTALILLLFGVSSVLYLALGSGAPGGATTQAPVSAETEARLVRRSQRPSGRRQMPEPGSQSAQIERAIPSLRLGRGAEGRGEESAPETPDDAEWSNASAETEMPTSERGPLSQELLTLGLLAGALLVYFATFSPYLPVLILLCTGIILLGVGADSGEKSAEGAKTRLSRSVGVLATVVSAGGLILLGLGVGAGSSLSLIGLAALIGIFPFGQISRVGRALSARFLLFSAAPIGLIVSHAIARLGQSGDAFQPQPPIALGLFFLLAALVSAVLALGDWRLCPFYLLSATVSVALAAASIGAPELALSGLVNALLVLPIALLIARRPWPGVKGSEAGLLIYLVGILSLAALPPFASFAGRWGSLLALAERGPLLLTLGLIASVLPGLAAIRWSHYAIGTASRQPAAPQAIIEGAPRKALLVILAILLVALGLFPGPLQP